MSMYPNYYGYQPYYPMMQGQPMQDNLSQLRNQQATQAPIQTPPTQNNNSGLIWVQGETGAKSYLVAPNTTVMLMDSEASKFYLKSADASGMPLPLRVFEYAEVGANAQGAQNLPPQNTSTIDMGQFVTHDELNAILAEFKPVTKKAKGDKESE